MPPPPHTKPENVLKRAQELIAVEQAPAALAILHEHVTSKRSRNSPLHSLEPVMLLFVELCVDLKKGKLAKDGLYQYKNTAQSTNVGTIELVLKKFIQLAEAKVTEAQEKAEQIQSSLDPSSSGLNVDDLEAIETPESILLSTVSGQQAKDRTDRAIVTPWLKFLWETYRTVLEILKNNSRLEVMYQSAAFLAFSFCQKFARKTEFRRLCELLRNHVQNAAKYQSQMHAIDLNNADTLQRHLDTRFEQLSVAVELELWQEAFRSVEDIHTLLSLSKRPAKNVMMANYYEKLTRIFLVSENYLFHAAAWNRYYSLLRQAGTTITTSPASKKENPVTTESDMLRAASFVLMSMLSIPVISTSRSRGALVEVDEARKNKNNRLTNLLGMFTAPTRASLFKDAMGKGILKRVSPEIRELYEILEVDFHPLSICKKISPILTQIGADAEMAKYIVPLQQVILTRLFQQLSQVYESVELKYVYQLAQFPEPYQITEAFIERFIMNGCKKGDLAMRVDHTAGVLTFDPDIFSSAKALHPGNVSGSADGEISAVQRLQRTPAEIVRSQLTRLAQTMFITCQLVDSEFNESRQRAKALAFDRAATGSEQEHQDTLARRAIIEKKKEMASDALQRKQKEEETRKRIAAQQRQEAEALRLAEEHKERERKRMKDEQERIRRENNEKELNDLVKKGINIGDVDAKDLDSNQLRLLRISQLEKEKNDLFKNLRVTGKRIDHLERAFRKEELRLIPKDFEAQRQRDAAAYQEWKSDTLKESERKHKEDVALKHRLIRLLPAYDSFHTDLKERRHDEFEKRRKAADREFQSAVDKRKREYREKKAREEREREEAEKRAREEEERISREAAERAAAEEEKRRLQADAKAKREEERRALDEKAALQRQREAEAEAKLEAKKAALTSGTRLPDRGAPVRASTLERGETSERPSQGRPRFNFGGKTPNWSEREEAKKVQQSTTTAASPSPATNEESQSSKKPSSYVPPGRRSGTDGGASRGRPDGSPSGGGLRQSESPADATPRWRPSSRRDDVSRDDSPADGAPSRTASALKTSVSATETNGDADESNSITGPRNMGNSASEQRKPTPGKYIPVHLRNRQ